MRLCSPYWLLVVLILALVGLQYCLWVGNGSLAQVRDLQKQTAGQYGENERPLRRSRILEAEVAKLKKDIEIVEKRVRHELDMVKDGEALHQLAKRADDPSPGDDFRPSRLLGGDSRRRHGLAYAR